MRKIALIILSLFPFVVLGQNDNALSNYSIVDNGVVWQKVFDSPSNMDIANYFISNRPFNTPVLYNSTLSGSTTEKMLDYQKFGSANGIFTQPAVVHYKIEIREGRYRVTVSEIEWKGVIGLPLSALAINGKKEFRKSFINTTADLLNKCLIDLFEIKKDAGGDDW